MKAPTGQLYQYEIPCRFGVIYELIPIWRGYTFVNKKCFVLVQPLVLKFHNINQFVAVYLLLLCFCVYILIGCAVFLFLSWWWQSDPLHFFIVNFREKWLYKTLQWVCMMHLFAPLVIGITYYYKFGIIYNCYQRRNKFNPCFKLVQVKGSLFICMPSIN